MGILKKHIHQYQGCWDFPYAWIALRGTFRGVMVW